MMQNEMEKTPKTCFNIGYKAGVAFARKEADYDELAAIYRAGNIPKSWDIFRAEIINDYLGDVGFDFHAYAAGFSQACIEFFITL